MSRTFAQTAAANDAEWIAIVQMDGAPAKYCSERPSYADSNYRDWLMDWPRVAAERVDPLGGVPESGELEVVLLDWENTLTSEWQIERDPDTYLDAAITSGATSFSVLDASAITVDSVIHIGSEAITVVAKASNTLTSVTRARHGTDATPHGAGDPVYRYIPQLHSRRLKLSVVNKDAASSSQERELGSFYIDDFDLTDDLCGWVLRGRSQLKWLSREVSTRPKYRAIVTSFRTGPLGPEGSIGSGTDFQATPIPDARNAYASSTIPIWPDARHYFRNTSTGEIFIASSGDYIWNRAMLGTRQRDIKPGDEFVLVYGADPDPGIDFNPSFFRFSPGPSPSEDRDDPDWTMSCNWIDLILNLATSSADPADGLQLTNYDADYGNWSCLPIGVGIGVPHAQIDLDAAVRVRERTPDFLFPDFYVDEPMPFADLIELHFLKPIGAYLSTVGGVAKIILPRMPLAGDTGIAIGPSEILRRPVGDGVYLPRFGAGQRMSRLATSVVYELKHGVTIPYTNGDYAGTYGQGGYYGFEEKPIKIPAPSVRADANGRSAFLKERAAVRIRRGMRAPWDLKLSVDQAQYASGIGTQIDITHADMPNLSNGTRGWTSVAGEVNQVGFKLSPEEGMWFDWQAISYGPNFRAGRIAPAARIVSVASAGGGHYDVTVTTNRFTQGDATGMPGSDSRAFYADDVLKLCTRAGVSVTGTGAKIVSISGDVIRVDADFGGGLTVGTGNAGQILRYENSGNVAAQQTNRFVFFADKTNRTVGGLAQPPFRFGEP